MKKKEKEKEREREDELKFFVKGLNSMKDLFESPEYFIATRSEKIKLVLFCEQHLLSLITDKEEENKMFKDGSFEIIRQISTETLEEIDNELNVIEDAPLKILFLEKKIAERIHDEALTDLECGFMFVEKDEIRRYNPLLTVLSGKLELLKKEFAQNTRSQNIDGTSSETFENVQINPNSQEKFIYCFELGVIDHLKKLIENKGQKYTDAKLYTLLALITGINESTIKRYMPFAKNKSNASEVNPFSNQDLIKRIEQFLINNGLK